MFKALMQPILTLFEENTYPELDPDEKQAIQNKHTRILRLLLFMKISVDREHTLYSIMKF